MLEREVGPERRHEHKLRIGRLPQQEVAEPLLAAGADHQIEVRQVAGLKVALERLFRDLVGIEVAVADLLGDPADRIDDLLPPTVVDGDREGERRVVPGALLGL